MDTTTISRLLEKLENDTLSKAITWKPISDFPEELLNTNKDLAALLYNHAHSTVRSQQSYYAENTPVGSIYLICRRSMSGKDGTIFDTLSLYLQYNELGNCIHIDAPEKEIVSLATILKNVCPNTARKQVDTLIKKYLHLDDAEEQ